MWHKRTGRAGLAMSVDWGRPEVAGGASNRRDCLKPDIGRSLCELPQSLLEPILGLPMESPAIQADTSFAMSDGGTGRPGPTPCVAAYITWSEWFAANLDFTRKVSTIHVN
jgi:hypothetical protein